MKKAASRELVTVVLILSSFGGASSLAELRAQPLSNSPAATPSKIPSSSTSGASLSGLRLDLRPKRCQPAAAVSPELDPNCAEKDKMTQLREALHNMAQYVRTAAQKYKNQAQEASAPAAIEGMVTSLDLSVQGKPVTFARKKLACNALTPCLDADSLTQTCQTIRGFGFAVTDSTLINFEKLSEANQRDTMEKLFDPRKGAGFTYLVLPISSTDFNDPAQGDFSVCDCETPPTEPGKYCFTPARIEKHIQFLQQAQKINPSIKVMLKSWSPPPYMKKPKRGSKVPGYRGGDFDNRWIGSLAACLSEAVDWVSKKGITVQSVAAQNEPGLNLWYPSAYMNTEALAGVMDGLDERISNSYPDVQLVLRADNMVGTWDARNTKSKMKRDVKSMIYSGHCYSGAAEKLEAFTPNKEHVLCGGNGDLEYMMGECTGSGAVGKGDFDWWIKTRVFADLQAGATGVLAWNGILDEKFGPRNGGCGNCRGLLTTDFSKAEFAEKPGEKMVQKPTLTWNPEFQALAQVSRFVRDGAQRLIADKTDAAVDTLIFKNPDGTKVGLFLNSAAVLKTVRIATKDCASVDVEIPAKSVLTLRWE
jgi:glucosylceramidase